jgi:hypothetical protein
MGNYALTHKDITVLRAPAAGARRGTWVDACVANAGRGGHGRGAYRGIALPAADTAAPGVGAVGLRAPAKTSSRTALLFFLIIDALTDATSRCTSRL